MIKKNGFPLRLAVFSPGKSEGAATEVVDIYSTRALTRIHLHHCMKTLRPFPIAVLIIAAIGAHIIFIVVVDGKVTIRKRAVVHRVAGTGAQCKTHQAIFYLIEIGRSAIVPTQLIRRIRIDGQIGGFAAGVAGIARYQAAFGRAPIAPGSAATIAADVKIISTIGQARNVRVARNSFGGAVAPCKTIGAILHLIETKGAADAYIYVDCSGAGVQRKAGRVAWVFGGIVRVFFFATAQ